MGKHRDGERLVLMPYHIHAGGYSMRIDGLSFDQALRREELARREAETGWVAAYGPFADRVEERTYLFGKMLDVRWRAVDPTLTHLMAALRKGRAPTAEEKAALDAALARLGEPAT